MNGTKTVIIVDGRYGIQIADRELLCDVDYDVVAAEDDYDHYNNTAILTTPEKLKFT